MNVKKGLLIIAIAVVLAFFVGYGIEVFDPTPNYDQTYRKFNTIYTEQECLAEGGNWIKHQPPRIDTPPPKPIAEEEAPTGYCEAPSDKIDQERAKHDKIVFIVAVILGVLSTILGLVLNKDTISTGIVSGGVLLILYGTIRYWRYANNILKFTLLGVALAVLIWLAYKKLDTVKKNNSL